MVEAEYNIKEMHQFLKMTGGLYDIVRLIEPKECREIKVDDGQLQFQDGCYNVWESEQRCKNCSSYRACMSGIRREKEEFYADKVFHILSNPVHLRLDDGTILDCVIEFITSHTASEEEKQRVNHRSSEQYESATLLDPLTGLLNWDGFHQRARRLLKEHPDEPYVIVASDIAQFNLVNSLFGRERANDILLEIARVFAPYRSDDTAVGRLQADQFAICMPKSLFDEAAFSKHIHDVNLLLDDSAFRLQFTIGIYEIKDRQLPISVMFDRAVMALVTHREDHAVEITWFDDSMLEELLHQQAVTSGFERTLKNGEYQIFLQPQVTSDGQVLGAEALARWVRPDGSIVPPLRFIPILEKAGLIAKLDRYVWELAARQLAEWASTPFSHFHISVNISALDFYYIDVYEAFVGLVEKYNIDRHKLKLEITETAIMSDTEKQILRIRKLREYGFTVEIDDFGSGYSSLAMLKDIEADILKIDMTFLRETEHELRSRQVLKSIVEMADKLNMDTITEGVEKPEQVRMLRDMGCNMFQGFYFAKPVPINEFEEYARARI